MISEYFIKRPAISIALAIMVVVFGFISIFSMPISQYPKLTPPTISINATYPGADASTIATSVIDPIETQLSGIPGLMYISSSASNSGKAEITCTFEIGTDVNDAYTEIQNRVQNATSTIPAIVKTLGVSIKKKTSDILLIVALHSPDNSVNQIALSNYASNFMIKKIKTIDGAGEANIFGQKDYSMRIWTDPVKMASYGITSKDINLAITEQNGQVSIGRIGSEPAPQGQVITLMLKSKGRLSSVGDFENIVIKTNDNGSLVSIKDVAKVELGTTNYEFAGRLNGKPTVLIGIFADPDANALDTAKNVKEVVEKLSQDFPKGIEYRIPYDTTTFVELSIYEVLKTFAEALLLVSLVVFFFLHSLRVSIIPILAIPVSIMGAFIGMYIFGFSINTLTLFGLVLSIGIVVDDAIVVVENIERIMKSEKLSPYEASIKAMKQISSPIIAIVLVIISVFIPTMFVGGILGELYKQFSLTIAVSVVFSGLVALILSPALCSIILKHEEKKHPWFEKFDNYFSKITVNYVDFSMKLINRYKTAFFVYLLFFGFIYYASTKIPSTFLPQEDQGVFITTVSLPEGASVQRTLKVIEDIEKIYKKEPEVQNVVAMVGSDSPNSAMIYTRLTLWSDRGDKNSSVDSLIKRLTKKTQHINEAQIMLMQPPAIRGLGRSSGLQIKLVGYGDATPFELATVSDNFASSLSKYKENFMMAKNTTKTNSPTLYLELDRNKAKAMGISIADVYSVLQDSIGYSNVNQFEKDNHLYWVQVQADGKYRATPDALQNIYVKNNKGVLVPISEIGFITDTMAPSKVEHFNGVLSNSISAMTIQSAGTAAGMEIAEMEALNLPSGFGLEWEGVSYQEKLTQGKGVLIFAFSVIVVFLVLTIQYNSFILPFSVLLSVVFGIFGAFGAAYIADIFFKMPRDVYFSIGLLTMIALSSKNAILIVEFAEQLRKNGVELYEATKQAAKIRYRPMMMTSIAFIFGILPLVFSSGAGAESRKAIGIGLLGGMIAATFIERYFIPYIYFFVLRAREYLLRKFAK